MFNELSEWYEWDGATRVADVPTRYRNGTNGMFYAMSVRSRIVDGHVARANAFVLSNQCLSLFLYLNFDHVASGNLDGSWEMGIIFVSSFSFILFDEKTRSSVQQTAEVGNGHPPSDEPTYLLPLPSRKCR